MTHNKKEKMNKIAIAMIALAAIFSGAADASAKGKHHKSRKARTEQCVNACVQNNNGTPDSCPRVECPVAAQCDGAGNCTVDSCPVASQCPAFNKENCPRKGDFKKGRKGKFGIQSRSGRAVRSGKADFTVRGMKNDPFSGIELTADQQKKLGELRADRKKEAGKIKEENKEKRAELKAEYDKKVKEILTEEQYAKYKANQVIMQEDARFAKRLANDRPQLQKVNSNATVKASGKTKDKKSK